jgi:hypothetical protein
LPLLTLCSPLTDQERKDLLRGRRRKQVIIFAPPPLIDYSSPSSVPLHIVHSKSVSPSFDVPTLIPPSFFPLVVFGLPFFLSFFPSLSLVSHSHTRSMYSHSTRFRASLPSSEREREVAASRTDEALSPLDSTQSRSKRPPRCLRSSNYDYAHERSTRRSVSRFLIPSLRLPHLDLATLNIIPNDGGDYSELILPPLGTPSTLRRRSPSSSSTSPKSTPTPSTQSIRNCIPVSSHTSERTRRSWRRACGKRSTLRRVRFPISLPVFPLDEG